MVIDIVRWSVNLFGSWNGNRSIPWLLMHWLLASLAMLMSTRIWDQRVIPVFFVDSNAPRQCRHLTENANIPDSKVHGTNMGPSGADRTQVGPLLAP